MQNPAQSLLFEYLHPQADACILLLEGGDGELALAVAPKVPHGEVLSLARDVRQVWATKKQLETIPNATSAFDVFPTSANWDIVLLTIPKGRRYARTLLLAAWQALKPGGRLLLAGPGKGGAKAIIKDAERLFGNATVLGYRRHQRVAACLRGEQLPNPLPKEFQQTGIAPRTRHFIEIQRPEDKLTLETHPGIFSWQALDEGTALLLEHLTIKPGTRVWDVGCGYGVIGLSAALAGADFVAMSDVNLISVDYTKQNAINNGYGNGQTDGVSDKQMQSGEQFIYVFAADGLSFVSHTPCSAPQVPLATTHFDLIVSNPPFHQGHAVDKSMADELIANAPDRLSTNGRLLLVANRFLNYDKSMQPYFRQVARIAETNKFHLIEART